MTKEELFKLYDRNDEVRKNFERHADHALWRKFGEALLREDEIERQLAAAHEDRAAAEKLWYDRLDADENLCVLNAAHNETMTRLLRARSCYIAEHPDEQYDESGYRAFLAWRESGAAA